MAVPDRISRVGLPIVYFFLSLLALVEVGISGYLVGRGDANGAFGNSIKSVVRFALFTSLWTLVFGTIIGVGTLRRMKFINTGFVHFIYLIITFIFWLSVGAALQNYIGGTGYPHKTTLRACEWIGWIQAILTALVAIPLVLLGVAHAKGGIRGEVATSDV